MGTRLTSEERREHLLHAGVELLGRHGTVDISIEEIARAAGVSKGLLYHYFTSKQELFRATLEDAARDLAMRIQPDESLPPAERVSRSVDAYLDWIEANEDSYVHLIEDVGSVSEVRELVTRVREETAVLIATQSVEGDPPRALVTAALGWLWYMDGVCLDWLARRHMTRTQVRDLLLAVLFGSVMAASSVEPSVELKLG